MVWQQFCDYRYLDSQLLLEEFTQDFFLIIPNKKDEADTKRSEQSAFSAQDEFDIAFNATINQITFHTYLIRRLGSMKRLCQLFQALNGKIQIDKARAYFKHEQIVRCLYALKTTRLITPFDELLERLFRYEFLDDVLFYQEILQLCSLVIHALKAEANQELMASQLFEDTFKNLVIIDSEAQELHVRYLAAKHHDLRKVIGLLERYWYVPLMSGMGFLYFLR